MIDKCNMRQITLLLFRFLGQNVTLERVFAFQFTCSGKRKALFGTGISFYFWHFVKYLIVNNRSAAAISSAQAIFLRWLLLTKIGQRFISSG